MGCYVIFADTVSNERAFLLADLCKRLQIDYYSEYTDSTKTAQYCAVGPVTKGDKDQVKNCLANDKYIVMEAMEIENQ